MVLKNKNHFAPYIERICDTRLEGVKNSPKEFRSISIIADIIEFKYSRFFSKNYH